MLQPSVKSPFLELTIHPENQFRQEFIEGSGIDPQLFESAIEVVNDLVTNIVGDVATPIHDALNWRYTRFGLNANPNQWAALFLNEDGSCWQAKLSTPRKNFKKGTFQKYETPVGQGSQAFFPKIPKTVWQAICDRYQAPLPTENQSFWEWIRQNSEIPIVLTEGGKKALSLLSQGYVAIALYGINGGYRTTETIGGEKLPLLHPTLISDLVPFMVPDRSVTLAFDQDVNGSTRSKVQKALSKFGLLLQKQDCQVKVAQWDSQLGLCKGIDDLLVQAGAAAWEMAYDQAIELPHWLLQNRLEREFTRQPTQTVHTAQLSTLFSQTTIGSHSNCLPQEGIVILRSPKGTEKTKLLSLATRHTNQVITLTHLISLGRNLADRLDGTFRNDLDFGGGYVFDKSTAHIANINRLTACVAGLGWFAQRIEHYIGCDLVLDEAVQVARTLLTSSTCNNEGGRPALLAIFEKLVRNAKRVLCADADFDDATIQWIESIRNEKAWILVNHHRPTPYPTKMIDSRDRCAAIADIVSVGKKLEKGTALWVATDSKGLAKTLKELLEAHLGSGSVLAIHSESVGGSVERALLRDPNGQIPVLVAQGVKVFIGSPSISTGVSIEVQDIFKVVYGLFTGVSLLDTDMLQQLSRIRQPVERRIWCVEKGLRYAKTSKALTASQFKRDLKQRTSATVLIARSSLTPAVVEQMEAYNWDSNPHLSLYANFGATQNRAMVNLRSQLVTRLKMAGHSIEIIQPPPNSEMRNLMTELRAAVKQRDAEAIWKAATLSYGEKLALDEKQKTGEALSPEERLAVQRFQICEFYVIPPEELTLEDVLNDRNGRAQIELRRLEEFLHPELATRSTAQSIETQVSQGQSLTPWDFSNAETRNLVFHNLGLSDFIHNAIAGGKWYMSDLEPIAEKLLQYRKDLEVYLGYRVSTKISITQLVHQLCTQIGITFTRHRQRQDKKVLSFYTLNQTDFDKKMAILSRRLADRERLTLLGSTTQQPLIHEGGIQVFTPQHGSMLSTHESPIELNKEAFQSPREQSIEPQAKELEKQQDIEPSGTDPNSAL
ncbi:plasmid replication protein, CyRepA1 family [Alkalinema pantanalense CENA528]|uniref:plasmid replication protein, CyRepA1 family n=1 Tax=Alkalinema pantanalense TaxID=1620705 RepID=UPI003D701444